MDSKIEFVILLSTEPFTLDKIHCVKPSTPIHTILQPFTKTFYNIYDHRKEYLYIGVKRYKMKQIGERYYEGI